MKLVAHLIASDVRRFRWLFLVWVLIEVTATTLSGIQPTLSATTRQFDLIGIVTNLLWLAELLLLMVLVPLVVQADPLVGTDAFWLTRPIPPRSLLAAKVILLGIVIGLVPIVIEGAVMIAYRVPLADVLRVAAQNIVFQALWLMILMAAASVTSTLGRYALLFASVVIGVALLTAISALVETGLGRHAPLLSGLPAPDNPTESLLLLLLLTAAGLAMIAVQYATRSWVRSAAVGVAAVVIAIYMAPQWPWPLFGGPSVAPEWARDETTLRLLGNPGTVKADTVDAFDGNVVRYVRAQVRVDALPPGWSARASLENARLELRDGKPITSLWGFGTTALIASDNPQPGLMTRNVLAVNRLEGPQTEEEAAVVLMLTADEFTRLGQAQSRYDGRFKVELTHHEVEAVLPLGRGALHQRGAFRIMVDGVRREDVRRASVFVHESDASSMFDRGEAPTRSYYLRHPQRREAVLGTPEHRSTDTPIPRALPMAIHNEGLTGFSASARHLRFGPSGRAGESTLLIDDEWLAGAELVIVRSTPAGTVERTLAIEDFSVPPAVRSSSR